MDRTVLASCAAFRPRGVRYCRRSSVHQAISPTSAANSDATMAMIRNDDISRASAHLPEPEAHCLVVDTLNPCTEAGCVVDLAHDAPAEGFDLRD